MRTNGEPDWPFPRRHIAGFSPLKITITISITVIAIIAANRALPGTKRAIAKIMTRYRKRVSQPCQEAGRPQP